MGNLSYVLINAFDPLPDAAQIMAGLSGTGAAAIHAGQRSIMCGRDEIAQELIGKYGAAVWLDAADARFEGSAALEGGLVDALPNRLDRIERVHGVGHMGASWVGGGSAPPTVDGSATHMGADCVSATFTAADYGASGYIISRALPGGDGTYKYLVTQGTRTVIKARIAVSRDLQSGESVTLRSSGGVGFSPSSYMDLQAWQWYELVADAGTPAASGGFLNVLFVYLSGNHSAPLTVYLQEHTIWEHSDSTLAQLTTSKQPRLVRASNGRLALQGDGVDDFLAGEIALPGKALWSATAYAISSAMPRNTNGYFWSAGSTISSGSSDNKSHLFRVPGDTDNATNLLYSPESGQSSTAEYNTGYSSDYIGGVVVAQRVNASGGKGYAYRPSAGTKITTADSPGRDIDDITGRVPYTLLARSDGNIASPVTLLGTVFGSSDISNNDLSDIYDMVATYYKVGT